MLLDLSRRLLGDTATDFVLKQTLFGQFCAGTDQESIRPTLSRLRTNGIGGILDYAAENEDAPSSSDGDPYDSAFEVMCDRHVEAFRQCIRSVHEVAPQGFAAVKVTALGNPHLLERMSLAICEVESLFQKFDLDRDGMISRDEFERGYRHFFSDGDTKLPILVEELDPGFTGEVDYITWCMRLNTKDLPEITSTCRNRGPLAKAVPTERELELMDDMFERAHILAKEASDCGTRVLIDAEQARFQPAIDNLVLEMQRTYNCTSVVEAPIIFNTYQCYLKGTTRRIQTDLERANRFGFHFGAKLVRGAYMESERALAKEAGLESPIHETLEDTHRCYNESIRFLLNQTTCGSRKTIGNELHVMCATHNRESIEEALSMMKCLGMESSDPRVSFGQLLGMSDNLTFPLGDEGYNAFKYIPYGQVREVIAYLMRRVNENSSVLGNAQTELDLLHKELRRRVLPSFLRSAA